MDISSQKTLLIREQNIIYENLFCSPWQVVNSFIQCLEDEDITVKKNCLDFMIKFAKFQNNFVFDEEKRIALLKSIFLLFQKYDLSLVKRIFKYLFNTNDVSTVDTAANEATIALCSRAYRDLLDSNILSRQPDIPFSIIFTFKSCSEDLCRQLLNQNVLLLCRFAYRQSLVEITDMNAVVVEQLNRFVKDVGPFMEEFLRQFQKQVKQEASKNDDLYLYEFVLKKFVLEGQVQPETRFEYILFFCGLIFQYIKRILDQSATLELPLLSAQLVDGRESFVAKIEKLLILSSECTTILNDIVLEGGVRTRREEVVALREEFATAFESLIEKCVNNNEVLAMYHKFLEIPMRLDYINYALLAEKPQYKGLEELPRWAQLNFKYTRFESEILCFQSLKFLYWMLLNESRNELVESYNAFFYRTPAHFVPDGLCWRLLATVVDVMEVSDFRQLALSFFQRLLALSRPFVEAFLVGLLRNANLDGFRKLSVIWSSTSRLNTPDVRAVLQATVHHMFEFFELEDPLIINYFKNWLFDSQDNFYIIIDVIIQDLLGLTTWTTRDKTLFYETPFSCANFLVTLKYLRTLLHHGSAIFVNYISHQNASEAFTPQIDQLAATFDGLFRDNNRLYINLIVQVLLRLVKGELALAARNDQPATVEHLAQINHAKERICRFLEELLTALSDPDLVAELAFRLTMALSSKLEEAVRSGQLGLQMAFLMLMRTCLHRSEVLKNRKYSKFGVELFESQRFFPVVLSGLQSSHSFIVKEYVGFITQLYPFMAHSFKHPYLTQLVRSIVLAYLNYLVERCEKKNSLKEEEQMKEVAIELMSGLDYCLQFFLQTSETEERVSSSHLEKTVLKIFTLGILDSRDEVKKKFTFNRDQNTCNSIINSFEILLEKFIVCLHDVRLVADTNLFAHFDPHKTSVFERSTDDIFGVRKGILELLAPLAAKLLPGLTDAFLQNWIKNSEGINIYNFGLVDSYLANIKLLDLLLHLRISKVSFLYYVLNGKQVKNVAILKRYENSAKSRDLIVAPDPAGYESAVLSFLFTYLKYESFAPERGMDIFGLVLSILKAFDHSVTPSTLMWILEVIDVLIVKVHIDFSASAKLKADWVTFVSELFGRVFRVCAKEVGLVYRETTGSEFKAVFPFNPCVTHYLGGSRARTLGRSADETFYGCLISRLPPRFPELQGQQVHQHALPLLPALHLQQQVRAHRERVLLLQRLGPLQPREDPPLLRAAVPAAAPPPRRGRPALRARHRHHPRPQHQEPRLPQRVQARHLRGLRPRRVLRQQHHRAQGLEQDHRLRPRRQQNGHPGRLLRGVTSPASTSPPSSRPRPRRTR